MNFNTVKLVTLLTNVRAQKVYNRIGFVKTGTIETHRGDIQVKFEYDLKKL